MNITILDSKFSQYRIGKNVQNTRFHVQNVGKFVQKVGKFVQKIGINIITFNFFSENIVCKIYSSLPSLSLLTSTLLIISNFLDIFLP